MLRLGLLRRVAPTRGRPFWSILQRFILRRCVCLVHGVGGRRRQQHVHRGRLHFDNRAWCWRCIDPVCFVLSPRSGDFLECWATLFRRILVAWMSVTLIVSVAGIFLLVFSVIFVLIYLIIENLPDTSNSISVGD